MFPALLVPHRNKSAAKARVDSDYDGQDQDVESDGQDVRMSGKAWYDLAANAASSDSVHDNRRDVFFINGKLLVKSGAKGTAAFAGLMSVLSRVYGGGPLKHADNNIIVNSVQTHSAHWIDSGLKRTQAQADVQSDAHISGSKLKKQVNGTVVHARQTVEQPASNAIQNVEKSNLPSKPPHRDIVWSPVDDIPATGSTFDSFLVVHKSKAVLERNRPNPYSEKLPSTMQSFLPGTRRDAYLDRAKDTSHAKVQQEVDLMGLGFLREHPEWGSDLFRRQWHLETRCVDICIARYFETAHKSCIRGAGGDLPVVQRILASWFHEVTKVVLREQVL
jgi:hypothetical protein